MFYDSDIYEKVKKGFNSNDKGRRTRNSHYGFVKGGEAIVSDNWACHAGVSLGGTGSDYIYSTAKQDTPVSDDDLVLFWKALLSTKVYGELLVTKDAERIVSDGFFVVDTNFAINRIMHLLILSRTHKEFPQVCEKIARMYEAGVQVELAVVLAHYMSERNNQIVFDRGSGGHHECMLYIEEIKTGYIKNMVLGLNTGKTCKENSSYTGVQRYFGFGGKPLMDIVKKYLEEGKIKPTYKTPFPHYHEINNKTLSGGKAEVIEKLAAASGDIMKEIMGEA